jgi:predicted AlkP superfamily pyrophosphatase or phosphodiesterase
MKKICIINVVGLTTKLLPYAPHLASVGQAKPWRSPLPAVTCTSQATMLTGLSPREHGIVGNGWYFRDTNEIRFWQQSNSLIQGAKLYEGMRTAKMFWWFNMNAPVEWSATPKPHYGSDGSKVFDILDRTDCRLQQRLGPFPFQAFWGPMAGLPSSQWIAKASSLVIREKQPELTLVYLPHLDYDFQRYETPSMDRVREVDACAAEVIEAARSIHAEIVVVSEYGLVPVKRSVSINQHLRKQGWLVIRDGPFGEMLMPGESLAFAVVDHQLAHIYVNEPSMIQEVQAFLKSIQGIDDVVYPEVVELDHSRSGELIALSSSDSWFDYRYWLDDKRAPDFARTVDIHRKPGYDPVELFMTSKARAMFRLMQKKIGLRYRMDVIPLDPTLVKGSHGLRPSPEDGPLIIGPAPPSDMREFKAYILSLR